MTPEDEFPEIPEIEGEAELGQVAEPLEELYVEKTEETLAPPGTSLGKDDYFRFFMQLFVEIYDVEAGLDSAVEKYTALLVERGFNVNPQEVFRTVEMMTSRLTRFMVIKRLCPALGLEPELDEILRQEMDLIYKNPRIQQSPKTPRGRAIGEEKDGA